MTEDELRMLKESRTHMGPTLEAEFELCQREKPNLLDKMKAVPICAVCPAARWYKIEDNLLECFCTEFRGVMYGVGRGSVTSCDARRDAITRAAETGFGVEV